MAYQIQKNKTTILLLILLALIILTVTIVMFTGDAGNLALARAVEGGGSPIYGTFDSNISPWCIDADRYSIWILAF
jgi:hypothetical protein